MRVNGVGKLTAKLSAMPPRTQKRVKVELGEVGKDLKGKSQSLAPYRPGEKEHLRDKAFSEVSKGTGGPSLEVGYDGPNGYLFVQHEGMWLNYMGNRGPKRIRNYTTPGTGAKFLERPWLAGKRAYVEGIKEAAREGMDGSR